MNLVGLTALITVVAVGAALSVWRSGAGESTDPSYQQQQAPQPVLTEEAEHRLVSQDDVPPADDVVRQRLEQLSDATGESRT